MNTPDLFAANYDHVMWPALFVMLIYGVRYMVFASLAFLVTRPQARFAIGRAHVSLPASWASNKNIWREFRNSLVTILIFGAVSMTLYATGWIRSSLMYYHLNDYSWLWFGLSIPVMILIHDTLFYWLHRAMHTPLLFNIMHRTHHQSVHPTAFAAYSFHPTEGLAEALLVVVIIFIIPVHPVALLIFQTISTAVNVYGHCGREIYPKGMADHWLGRWVNTSTSHARHHLKGRYNYGFYSLFWDRIMGTIEPDNKSSK